MRLAPLRSFAVPRSLLAILAPLAVYAAARAVSAVFILWAAPNQPDLSNDPGWHVSGELPADPSYWQIATNWDGQWYRSIAVDGYPSRGDPRLDGDQNELAFYPLYPFLVRGVMAVSRAPFEVVAPTVSLICGAIAIVMLHRWLAGTRGRAAALAGAAILCAFPSSPTLQIAYSDALAALLLVVALWSASARRWATLFAAAALLSLTRPIVAALALFLLVRGLQGWIARDRRRPPDWPFLAAAASVGALAFSWPLIVCMETGSFDAYFSAAQGWVRAGGLAGGWIAGIWTLLNPGLALFALGLIVALILVRSKRQDGGAPADRIGVWSGTYMLFILATTTVNTSIFRYALLTLLPLGEVGLPPDSRRCAPRDLVLLVTIIAIELALQWWWVANVLVVDDSPSQSWPP